MSRPIVSFTNPGVIDVRCITTQGASIKEGENPIGYFGTGLKYAIAIILRNSGKITIYRGTECLRFSAKPTHIRGKEFHIVCMNDKELGFTTELGKTWQMWQAFREIYCNTIDEDGGKMVMNPVAPALGKTTIIVESTEFYREAMKRGEYVLDGNPIYDHKVCAFFPTSRNVFYRGVRVKDNTYKPWLYTPNMYKEVELTEDRTLKYDFYIEHAVAPAIADCQDPKFLESWLLAGEEYMEHNISFSQYTLTHSPLLLTIARSAFNDPAKYKLLNVSVRAYLKIEDGEPLYGVVKTLLPVEQKLLDEAIAQAKAMGFDVDEYPIIVCETLGEGILGLAAKKAKRIYLARKALSNVLGLTGTLVEEWAHIKHNFDDCSRAFQDWLLENMIKLGASYLMQKEGK